MYTVNIYTAGQGSYAVTVPMCQYDAKKLAGKFNQDLMNIGVDASIQYFYIEKV